MGAMVEDEDEVTRHDKTGVPRSTKKWDHPWSVCDAKWMTCGTAD